LTLSISRSDETAEAFEMRNGKEKWITQARLIAVTRKDYLIIFIVINIFNRNLKA